MDQTLRAEGAKSAKQWYEQNAYAFLPLPQHVESFVSNARDAGRALAEAASKATASAVEEADEVAAFAIAVGSAFTAVARATLPLGIGPDLMGYGTTITVGAGGAQPCAEGALSGAWNSLDDAIDFFALAQNAGQDRGVNDDAKAQMKSFATKAAPVAEAVKGLLNL